MSDTTGVWLIDGTVDENNAGSHDTMELEFSLSDGSGVMLATDSSSEQWAIPHDDQGNDDQRNEASFRLNDVQAIDLEMTGRHSWDLANTFVVVEDGDSTYMLMNSTGDSNQCLSQPSSDCGGDAKSEITLYSAS